MANISAFELAFYKYICSNPQYFQSVKPEFFNDSQVRTVYNLVRSYYFNISSKGQSVQISPFDLSVLIEARDPEAASQISEDDLADFVISNKDIQSSISNDYIKEQLEKWVKWETFKKSTLKLSQEFKKLESTTGFIGIPDVDKAISGLKDGFVNTSTLSFDNSYIDFFDPNQHIVNEIKHFPTGYNFVDMCSDGGYWLGSLWVIAGAPKAGKSVVLQNFMSRSVSSGNNSAYISLEMQDGLSLHRLSSIVFDIKISDYQKIKQGGADALAKEFNRCTVESSTFNGGTLNCDTGKIPSDHGELVIKTFPTGTLTVTQLENFLLNVERDKSIKNGKEFKFKTIYVDYINIMMNEKNPTSENTYLKIKTISEDLRAMAQRNDWCIISATQTTRDQADKGGITVANISESVGLNATVDMMFGIIKTVDMDANAVLDLKCLLTRVSQYTNYRKEFNNNKSYLRLTESNAEPYIDSTIASPESKKGTKYGPAYSQNYTDSILTAKQAVNKAMYITGAVTDEQRSHEIKQQPIDIESVKHNQDTLEELSSTFNCISQGLNYADSPKEEAHPVTNQSNVQTAAPKQSILDSLEAAEKLGF